MALRRSSSWACRASSSRCSCGSRCASRRAGTSKASFEPDVPRAPDRCAAVPVEPCVPARCDRRRSGWVRAARTRPVSRGVLHESVRACRTARPECFTGSLRFSNVGGGLLIGGFLADRLGRTQPQVGCVDSGHRHVLSVPLYLIALSSDRLPIAFALLAAAGASLVHALRAQHGDGSESSPRPARALRRLRSISSSLVRCRWGWVHRSSVFSAIPSRRGSWRRSWALKRPR